MSACAVPDTACLIALERIGKLDLLPKIFRRILVTPSVLEELGSSRPWMEIREPVGANPLIPLGVKLQSGETAAIALAAETPGAVLILDDLKARHAARRLDLPITGTIGILLRAKREGHLGSVAETLDELDAAGFHVSADLRRIALRLAKSF